MSELDKSEYERIDAAILATEQAMAGNPHIRVNAGVSVFESPKNRLEEMERQGVAPHQNDDERKKVENSAVAIAALVMQETRLNSEEKQVYGGFLQMDFFTRNDFEELEAFYTDGGAWDKLSKQGKDEISTRIWAGIDRGEYIFSELPDTVRKKETEQLYEYLKEPESSPEFVTRIDPEVREEFKREYEAGNLEAAHEVLGLHGVKLDSVTKEQNQAATERSEVAVAADSEELERNVESHSNKVDVGKLAGLSAFSDLPQTSPDGGWFGRS